MAAAASGNLLRRRHLAASSMQLTLAHRRLARFTYVGDRSVLQ